MEYYFSKENLQSDAYLTSQMDANMSVPISVVMKVSHVQKRSFVLYCRFATAAILMLKVMMLWSASILIFIILTSLPFANTTQLHYVNILYFLRRCTITDNQFAKMKALTQDEEVLRKALENSTVSLIDNRIKANIKATGRSTIILREIPADTPEEEVRAIFAFDGCKPIVSMRSDIGDTW